jgi:steroid 5-alpha reductase family enzyme
MNVVHGYVPTLTPQPQAVLVTATDGTGQIHDRTVAHGEAYQRYSARVPRFLPRVPPRPARTSRG